MTVGCVAGSSVTWAAISATDTSNASAVLISAPLRASSTPRAGAKIEARGRPQAPIVSSSPTPTALDDRRASIPREPLVAGKFHTDSAKLLRTSKLEMRELAFLMKRCDGRVLLSSHPGAIDSKRGGPMARRRGRVVARLLAKHGVSSSSIAAAVGPPISGLREGRVMASCERPGS